MDRQTFNREIESYISDSKVSNKRYFSNMFMEISREFEESRTYFPEKLLNRIEEDLVSDLVTDLNRKLDQGLFGTVYSLRNISDENAVRHDLNNLDYRAVKRQAEKLVEEITYELNRNTFSRILRYSEMDRISINEDDVRSIVNASSTRAGNRIVKEVVNDSFDKLVNKLKDMVKTVAKQETREETNEKDFILDDVPSRNDFMTDNKTETKDFITDELGTTVKPNKPSYDLNHFDKNRVYAGNEVEMKDVPEDAEIINYNDGCFLISPNDITKIYYFDESLKDKCRLLEDPADIEAAAKEIQKSDFYKNVQLSAQYDESLKTILDEFENNLKKATYDRGMRDLVGEEGYMRMKKIEAERNASKLEESENAKAFL